MAIDHVTKTGQVNNDIYRQLGERWYTAQDDPIALLRAESRARNPWIAGAIRRIFPSGEVKVLDIGCGGGFLSNYLAEADFAVTGLDASAESLTIAQRYDATGRACYVMGDAYHLPYANGAFQAACAMDFLEHILELRAERHNERLRIEVRDDGGKLALTHNGLGLANTRAPCSALRAGGAPHLNS
jgi:2-polyprenyl-3-methyl-5-hydroxy-6-metoxy-1,4-benzoquinol methylase